jgi:hypothetical protein
VGEPHGKAGAVGPTALPVDSGRSARWGSPTAAFVPPAPDERNKPSTTRTESWNGDLGGFRVSRFELGEEGFGFRVRIHGIRVRRLEIRGRGESVQRRCASGRPRMPVPKARNEDTVGLAHIRRHERHLPPAKPNRCYANARNRRTALSAVSRATQYPLTGLIRLPPVKSGGGVGAVRSDEAAGLPEARRRAAVPRRSDRGKRQKHRADEARLGAGWGPPLNEQVAGLRDEGSASARAGASAKLGRAGPEGEERRRKGRGEGEGRAS